MSHASQWTSEKANIWYAQQPWLVGANFIPSNAINRLEMWQADTFDLTTIMRELGWAADIGMNTVRVYLHDLLWEADSAGFISRINQFLDASVALGIRLSGFTIFFVRMARRMTPQKFYASNN